MCRSISSRLTNSTRRGTQRCEGEMRTCLPSMPFLPTTSRARGFDDYWVFLLIRVKYDRSIITLSDWRGPSQRRTVRQRDSVDLRWLPHSVSSPWTLFCGIRWRWARLLAHMMLCISRTVPQLSCYQNWKMRSVLDHAYHRFLLPADYYLYKLNQILIIHIYQTKKATKGISWVPCWYKVVMLTSISLLTFDLQIGFQKTSLFVVYFIELIYFYWKFFSCLFFLFHSYFIHKIWCN